MPPLVNKLVEKRRARVLKTRPQVRKTFPPEPELRALARSVMKRQIHPLILLPDDTILDGECRWRGLMLENPDFELDAIVVDRELSRAEVCELQMVSALHSTSLTPFDQAVACKEWMEQNPGATAKQLAEKIDRDPSMLTRLGSLWKTIPEVVQAAEDGKIGPKAWYALSQLPAAEQAGLLAKYLAGAPASEIAECSRKKRATTTPSVTLKRVKMALPQGTTVVLTGAAMSLDDVIGALESALAAARRAHKENLDVKTAEKVWRDKAKAG